MHVVRVLVCAAGLALAAPATRAHMEAQSAQALQSSLPEALSFLMPGWVEPTSAPLQITATGPAYQVQMAMQGADVPLRAQVVPADNGSWILSSVTMPPDGSFGAGLMPGPIHYSFGSQSIHGRLDPSLATPSAGQALLKQVTIDSGAANTQVTQAYEAMEIKAELSPTASGLLDYSNQRNATDGSIIWRNGDTLLLEAHARGLQTHVGLLGLNPARVQTILGLARAVSASRNLSLPSPDWPDQARSLFDAVPGTLTHLRLDEAIQNIALRTQDGQRAGIGTLHVAMSGEAADDRVNADLSVSMDEVSSSTIPPDFAMFLPHHVSLKPVLSGVPSAPLLALLREATEPGADPSALRQHALALLQAPGAKATVDALRFDSGPLHVEGSARVQAGFDGQPAANIHLKATGVDALTAQVEQNPRLLRVLPVLLLLRGMGRAEGDSLTWDLRVGSDGIAVNGIPFGQPPAASP